MGALEDKVRKARIAAKQTVSAARDTVSRNTRTEKVNLTIAEKSAATKILKNRMQIDRNRTAARGTAIQKVQKKKAAAKRMAAATGNPQSKATPKATTKPMTEAQKQAKAMAALEARRAAAEKKTGVRPNYRTN